MPANVYIDAVKTKVMQDIVPIVCDGIKTKFIANYAIGEVYLDNIRITVIEIYENSVSFSSPPISGSVLILLPKNAFNMYIDSTGVGSIVDQLYLEITTSPVYIISENMFTGKIGDYKFSLDNVSFYDCLLLPVDTTTVYVKYSLTTAVNKVAGYSHNRIFFVESDTLIDSSGNITISFTVPGGSVGGVEIYEKFI